MARVLITREHASPMDSLLYAVGHDPVHVPLVSLCATGDPMPQRKPNAALVTSKAVVRFVSGLDHLLGGVRVAAVGQATADALTQAGVTVHIVGKGGGVEALAGLQVLSTEVAWFIGAKNPSGLLNAELNRLGVQQWGVYCNSTPASVAATLVQTDFDAVTFASGSAVRAFAAVMGPLDCPVFAIGRSTAAEARAAGFRRVAVALNNSLEALAASTAVLRG